MERKEFVLTAAKMGYAPTYVAEQYTKHRRHSYVYTDDDLQAVYRFAHPDVIGDAPGGGPPSDDLDTETDILDDDSPEKVRNINRDFVRGIYGSLETRGLYKPPETYIRDEKMRLVLNPKRLKGF